MESTSEASPALNFISLNESQSQTLLLAHGSFSSHHEWSLVSKHLPDYHILVPDLPGHGNSSLSAQPLSLPEIVSLFADLITKHAHGGKADVIGLSFGGYAVVLLAATHPELVRSVFASGCHLSWEGRWKNWFMGLGLGLNVGLVRTVPKSWFMWLCSKTKMMVSDEQYEDMCSCPFVRNGSRLAGLAVAHALSDFDKTWNGIYVRTLLVVGGKEPYPDEAGHKAGFLKVHNQESKAVKVEGMYHAWNLQGPELFAKGIAAWAQGKDLPEEYIVLNNLG